jgi:hypothetical protein
VRDATAVSYETTLYPRNFPGKYAVSRRFGGLQRNK